MTIAPDTEVVLRPLRHRHRHDPYPVYARLRDEAPIYYNERYDFWAISRHADVEKGAWRLEDLLQQPKRHPRTGEVEVRHAARRDDVPGPAHAHHVARVDVSGLHARRMAAIEDQIRQYCVRCLDPHVGSDGFDIIAELASMMPMRVIGMLLGIPEEQQIDVRDANDANLRTKPGRPMKVADADAIADGRIYADYVDWRAKNPSDDLMTALLNVEFEDENGVHPQADPQGGAALHPGGRRRRQRDNRPTHRMAGESPCRTSRSAHGRSPKTAAC